MSEVLKLWLGYGSSATRTTLDLGGPGSRMLFLGSRSSDLAILASLSAKDAGFHPILFDLDGAISTRLSGYFDTYDYHTFLYDSFRLEEPGPWHAQMAAAAYTAALDLSTEEEAIINHAMQQVASDGSLLSPVSLHEIMGSVEGFRGFYVDKLKGRVGSLRLFDAVDDQTFARLMNGDLIVDFHRAPYPLAAELSVALFLAKILAVAHSTGSDGGFIIMTEAHRLFRSTPHPAHSNRLLTHLLGWSSTVGFATDQPLALSPLLLEACPVRFYSSDVWHSQRNRVRRILPGTYLLDDRRTARRESFVPRRVLTKSGDYAMAKASRFPAPTLSAAILEHVERYPLCTPESVVSYLSNEFLAADISAALSSLQGQSALISEPKESGSGNKIFSLTITEEGRNLLRELRK